MAVHVDLNNLVPGYFYTPNFDDVISYTLQYLRLHNHSINFVIHASSYFRNTDGEEREFHMPACDPILLDPSMPDITNRIDLCHDEMHDPEAWGYFSDSGWYLVPCTFTYWFKIVPFQPNNTPNENDKNRKEPPDFGDEPEHPDDPNQPRNTPAPMVVDKYDSLHIALANYFVPNPNRLTKSRFYPKLVEWMLWKGFRPLIPDGPGQITPGTLASNHEDIGELNLRVFSEFGNVIYYRELEPGKPLIDLLWSNRKFKLITNLWALLGEKRDRIFCNLCRKFHRSAEVCREEILPANAHKVDVPSYPEGRHAYVTYADFESVVLPNNEHQCSGYSFICVDKEKIKINDHYTNVLDTPDITRDFIDNLFSAATDFAFGTTHMGGGDLLTYGVGVAVSVIAKVAYKRLKKTYMCPICDEEVADFQRYVEGTNFINGLSGRHHKSCWEDTNNAAICYFHNFRGYDSHYVLRELMRDSRYETKFIRGKTMEKFDIISVILKHNKGQIRVTFKDTFNYLATSIAKLLSQVQTWHFTPEKDRDAKGTFPYSWFNNIEKLKQEGLPPICDWYNDVTQTNVDPKPAQELWTREGFTYFAQFHDYYMRTDVYQLADIFEEFRDSCISAFNLDPVYFQGAPSYTWQLNLKLNADKMYLIQDTEVYRDIQCNIRGGIAQVMHRYINIEDKPNENILFLDVNSLYSRCMTYKLPTSYEGRIETLPENWEQEFTGDTDKTAFFCVDLSYPEHLHDLHTAYPLAPHKFNGRLCTTFLDKENYLCHAEALKFYLKEGLVLVKFHYGYIFSQDYILRDYVDENINKRRATSSPPLKTLYKLLNNSLYGKTCENKFKYRKFEVYKEERGLMGKINTYMIDATNWLPIEDKVLVEHKIKKVILDKPIQIGFAILELAKLEMYKFLFAVQEVFENRDVTPLYTDTDSVILHFKHPNPEEVLFNHPKTRPMLDFDVVPDHWKVRTPGTHKQNGLWSLETTERIVEFIGIRAKTYCYRTQDNRTVLKNKGITATAIELYSRDKLTMEHYRSVLFENKEIRVHQVTIGSKKHQLLTKKQNKLALINNDEKRMTLADKITSIPFGYKGEKYSHYIKPTPDLL